MRRRQFGAIVIGAITAWPLALAAQQSARVWRVGFMAHRYEKFYDPLFSGLRELGYVEGQNLIVERRYAEGNAERFKEFAAEMVRLNVDAIIVVTTPAAMAARNETKTIPIVHPAAIDPVGTGLISSLAYPGGNVTGLAVLNAETSAKRVELLREVVPGLSNGVVLWNSANPRQFPCLAGDGKRWHETGSKAQIAGGTEPEGFWERICGDGRTASRDSARRTGRPDTGVSKGNHRFCASEQGTRHVCRQRVGRRGGTDVLWRPSSRKISTRGGFGRQGFKGHKTGGLAGGAAHDVRVGGQSENRKGDRIDLFSSVPGARRSGH